MEKLGVVEGVDQENLEAEEMAKYGVDESVNQERLEKKAAEGCPECGAKPSRHGNVLICPAHGSEPFER